MAKWEELPCDDCKHPRYYHGENGCQVVMELLGNKDMDCPCQRTYHFVQYRPKGLPVDQVRVEWCYECASQRLVERTVAGEVELYCPFCDETPEWIEKIIQAFEKRFTDDVENGKCYLWRHNFNGTTSLATKRDIRNFLRKELRRVDILPDDGSRRGRNVASLAIPGGKTEDPGDPGPVPDLG